MTGRRRAALGLAVGLLAGLAALDGFWFEPRKLLWRDEVHLGLATEPLRLVHLSDLHIARESQIERRLLRRVTAERPDLIVISGDLVADDRDGATVLAHARAAAAVLRQLRAVAPVVAVQGHSEYLGPVVTELGRSGLEWLSNEGRRYGHGGGRQGTGFLLLGLNQQVGRDLPWPNHEPPFVPLTVDGEPAFGRAEEGLDNAYYLYDPPGPDLAAVPDLAATTGPLAWTRYTLRCDLRFPDRDSDGGVVVLSRYAVGEDRLLQFRRTGPESGASTFLLLPHGTGGDSGESDSGVDPVPGRWYRVQVKVAVDPDATRVEAKVWPADETEPTARQSWWEDRTPERLMGGTVGLWAREGTIAFRNFVVTQEGSGGDQPLLDVPLTGGEPPAGFHEGARASRIELALARSPAVAREVPRLVLAHVPDVAFEAAAKGLDAVLAGHTHGGQVRLPGGIALVTRSRLGTHYARGTFDFASPAANGWTRLYVNSGVGTSKLPVRFFCPPRYAVITVGR